MTADPEAVAAWVRRTVDDAPPPTPATLERVYDLLGCPPPPPRHAASPPPRENAQAGATPYAPADVMSDAEGDHGLNGKRGHHDR